MDAPDELNTPSTSYSHSDSLMTDTSNSTQQLEVDNPDNLSKEDKPDNLYKEDKPDNLSKEDKPDNLYKEDKPDNLSKENKPDESELNDTSFVSDQLSSTHIIEEDEVIINLPVVTYKDIVAKRNQIFRFTSPKRRRSSRFSDVIPWFDDAILRNLVCLGSITEPKGKRLLDTMDYLIANLTRNYTEYSKFPNLAATLCDYVRQCLFNFRLLYTPFVVGRDYFKRLTRLLAIYTDIELCVSMGGFEIEAEASRRILLMYQNCLEFAEEFDVADVFLNVKRLCGAHLGILKSLLQYFLNRIHVVRPAELPDDIFIKYLIIYKRWLAIEYTPNDREIVRNAFLTHIKPKRTLCMNISFAPYLPADEVGSSTIDNYLRMLDKKFSLKPLLRALEIADKNSMTYEELPNGIIRQISEIVILSDDEDETSGDPSTSCIKVEQKEIENVQSTEDNKSVESFVDLTDDYYNEINVCRRYIAWLSDLIASAKLKPITVDQRLEVATVSSDVIVIDDDDDDANRENNENVSHEDNNAEASVHSNVNNIDSTCSDSGCVIMNREEVGIHSNNNFDKSQSSSDTGVEEEEVVQDAVVCENTGGAIDDGINSSNTAANENFVTEHVATGSISSCSEPAAEQLLTVSSNESTGDTFATENRLESTSDMRECTTSNSITNINNEEISNSQNEEITSHTSNTGEPSSMLIVRQNSLLRTSYDDNIRMEDNTGNVRETEVERGREHDESDATFLSDYFPTSPIRDIAKESSESDRNEDHSTEAVIGSSESVRNNDSGTEVVIESNESGRNEDLSTEVVIGSSESVRNDDSSTEVVIESNESGRNEDLSTEVVIGSSESVRNEDASTEVVIGSSESVRNDDSSTEVVIESNESGRNEDLSTEVVIESNESGRNEDLSTEVVIGSSESVRNEDASTEVVIESNESGRNEDPSTEVVNPMQHTTSSTSSNASTTNSLSSDWFRDDNDVVSDFENTRFSQKRIRSPVPTSSTRPSNTSLRTPYWNETTKRLEQINRTASSSEQEREADKAVVHDDEEDLPRHKDERNNLRKYTGSDDHINHKHSKSASKSTPVPQHERSVRFADDIAQDTLNTDDNIFSNTKRRPQEKIDVPNLEQGVPSTIKARKSYIIPKHSKPQSGFRGMTITPTARSPPPTARSPSPTARSPPPSPTVLQQSDISPINIQNSSQDSSTGIDDSPETPTDDQQNKSPYRIYYSANKNKRRTPYDQKALEAAAAAAAAKAAEAAAAAGLRPPYINATLPLSPNHYPYPLSMADTYQKIDGCFVRCSILDAKIFSGKVVLNEIEPSVPAVREVVPVIKPAVVQPVVQPVRTALNKTFAQSTPNTPKSKQKSDFDKYLIRKRHEFDKYSERKKQRQTKRQRDDRQAERSKLAVTPSRRSNRYEDFIRYDDYTGESESEAENSVSSMNKHKHKHRRNILEVNLMVQLQREKSLRIFNSYNSENETMFSKKNLNAVTSNRKSNFHQLNSFNGNMSENRTKKKASGLLDRGAETDTDTYLRSNPKSWRRNQHESNRLTIREDGNNSQFKPYRKPRQKKRNTDRDIESEPEHNIHSTKQLQTLRRYNMTDIDTEAEDLVPNLRRSLRNLNKSRIAQSENELETKERKLNGANRSKVSSRYQKAGTSSLISGVLPSTANVNGKRGRKSRKSKNDIANKNLSTLLAVNPRLNRYLKDKKLTQVPIVKLYDLAQFPDFSNQVNKVNAANNDSVLNTEDRVENFPPLANLPNFNSIRYRKSFVGRSKSDINAKVSKKRVFYTKATKLHRRYSCFAGTKAPLDLSYQVITKSDNYAELCGRFIRNGSKNNNRPKTKGKRGRPKRNVAVKKNLTRQLLDSDDFSCILDIAKLQINSDEIDNISLGDDTISICDDLEPTDTQQRYYLKHPRLTAIPSTLKPPVRNSRHSVMDLTGDENITNANQTNENNTIDGPTATVNNAEINRTNSDIHTQNTSQPSRFLEKNVTKIPENNINGGQLGLPYAEQSVRPTDSMDNTAENESIADGAGNKNHSSGKIGANKDPGKIAEADLETNKHLMDNCDDDDIDSPAYEPHVSELQNQSIESDKPAVRKRLGMRLKRTRGRPRWSRPHRRKPPIQPCVLNTSELANISSEIPSETTAESMAVNETESISVQTLDQIEDTEYPPPPSPPLTTPSPPPQPPPFPPPQPVQQNQDNLENEPQPSNSTKEINDQSSTAKEQIGVELQNGSQDLDELGKMEQKTDEKEVQLSDSQNINNGQKKVKDWPLTLPPKPLVSLRLPTNKTILKRRIEHAGTMNRIKRGRRIIRSISVQNKIIRRSSAIPTVANESVQPNLQPPIPGQIQTGTQPNSMKIVISPKKNLLRRRLEINRLRSKKRKTESTSKLLSDNGEPRTSSNEESLNVTTVSLAIKKPRLTLKSNVKSVKRSSLTGLPISVKK